MTSQSGSKFGYVPALDGLRALAVVAVVLFHADFGFASGGFIGVSVFFTLSGFLITSLLIAEHNHSGGISLRRFYSRRVRRLLPASLLCSGLILAAVPFWAESQRRRLPGDALAALANVANWRSAFSDVSYRDLFVVAPSPFAHFWSLAIEEQCYLLLPIIVVVSLRRGRSRLAAVSAGLLALSVTAALLTSDFDVAYNGTHVRIAEVLVGVLLSVALTMRRPHGAVASVAGGAGLVLLAAAASTLSITDEWLAHGGLVLVSCLTCAVIVGAIGNGPVSWLLGRGPLVAIGKVSYGVYLYHWPIFLILSPERTGWDRWPLMAARLAVLAVVAVVSFRLVERPIRSGAVLRRPRVAGGVLATTMAALLVAVWALPGPRLSSAEQLLQDAQGGPVTFAPAASTVPPEPPTVLVVGSDPAAFDLLSSRRIDAHVVGRVQEGCPVLSGAVVQLLDGSTVAIDECAPTAAAWAAAIDATAPDLVVVSMGPLDDGFVSTTDDALFPAADDPTAVRSAVLRARAALGTVFEQLAARQVPVLVYWPASPDSPLSSLSESLLGVQGVNGVVATRAELLARIESELRSLATPAAPRVLVLGDSTSLPFAAALDRAAAGTLDVLWAGHEGCPFVRATAYRASLSTDQWFNEWFTPTDCGDFTVDMPPLLASFRPDVVIIMAGGTELMQQRYAGDDDGHLPGSATYQAYHDAEMAAFLAAVGAEGPPVLVADAPPVGEGGWAASGLSDPARTTGWNAQVARWDERHPEVQLLRFADALIAYEATHGAMREDGLHPEVEPLAEMIRVEVLPQIRAVVNPT